MSVSRRSFLKIAMCSSIPLPLVFSEKVYSGDLTELEEDLIRDAILSMFVVLLSSMLSEVSTDKAEYYSGEDIYGKCLINNDSDESKEGLLKLTLVERGSLDVLHEEKFRVALEPNSLNVFNYSIYNRYSLNYDFHAKIIAESGLNSISSNEFILKA